MKRLLISGIVASLLILPAFALAATDTRATDGPSKVQGKATKAKGDCALAKKDKQGKKVAKQKSDKPKAPVAVPARNAG